MANYPTSLPSATPADHGEVLGELVAIATELGTDPAGSSATVRERLEAVTPTAQGLSPHGNFVQSNMNARANANLAITANAAYLMPVEMHPSRVYAQIGIRVGTGGSAGSVIRLGLYARNIDGTPGALIVDAGTVDATTSGYKSVVVSFTPDRVPYCVAVACQGSPATAPLVAALNNNRETTGTGLWLSSNGEAQGGYCVVNVTGGLPPDASGAVDSGWPQPIVFFGAA